MSSATKPLTLFAMLLLTVIALAVGFLAYSNLQQTDARRSAEIEACIERTDLSEISAVDACLGR